MSANPFLDTSRSGVYHLPAERHAPIEAAANAARLRMHEVHLDHCADRQAALVELGEALRFPDWYGANLDALYDCLTDPDWQRDSGTLLLVFGLDSLRKRDPESFSSLTDVFCSASEASRDHGSPLWILLDAPAADTPELPNP